MGYLIDKYTVAVNIYLNPGVYVFRCESAAGKTYLTSLFKMYMTYGEPVNSYTYADYMNGVDLTSIIQSGKYKVLMLDRYDMYYGEAQEALRNPPKDVIILIDTKRWDWAMHPTGTCAIERSGWRITVA